MTYNYKTDDIPDSVAAKCLMTFNYKTDDIPDSVGVLELRQCQWR